MTPRMPAKYCASVQSIAAPRSSDCQVWRWESTKPGSAIISARDHFGIFDRDRRRHRNDARAFNKDIAPEIADPRIEGEDGRAVNEDPLHRPAPLLMRRQHSRAAARPKLGAGLPPRQSRAHGRFEHLSFHDLKLACGARS